MPEIVGVDERTMKSAKKFLDKLKNGELEEKIPENNYLEYTGAAEFQEFMRYKQLLESRIFASILTVK